MAPSLSHRLRWPIRFAFFFAVSIALAHEGHAPLPTKGAQVNIPTGVVTLSPAAHRALGVETAEVTLREPEERILAYATLVAPWQRHAFATSRSGGRISQLHVKPGQVVTAGELLAEVDSLEMRNLILDLLNAASDVELSAKIVEHMEPLRKNQAIPEREFAEARAKHEENLNALAISRSKLLNLSLTNEDLDEVLASEDKPADRLVPIFSPIAGTIIHADIALGQVIEPTEHLFEVVNLDRVWVKIGVLEKDLHLVEPGQKIDLRLSAYPHESISGMVEVKVPFLDPGTHVGTVWAELQNKQSGEPRYLPGLSGQAQITVSKPGKILAIPASALMTSGAERYVLVEEAATAKAFEYRKQNVVVASQAHSWVFLRGGNIFAGDRVVTAGAHELATYFVPGVLLLSKEALLNSRVKVEPAKKRIVEKVINVSGSIDLPPNQRAAVSTQLAGTVEAITVDRGQSVQRGDVIAELAGIELQNLQLEFLKADLQAELLDKLLKRRRTLGESQSLPGRQIWETESQFNSSVNQRDSSRRKLLSLGLTDAQLDTIRKDKLLLRTLSLRAPIDGVVVHFDKVLGQSIKAEEQVFEIHDLSRVLVQGNLSERQLSDVHLGQNARVRLPADLAFVGQGTVVRSGRVFGAKDRTLSIWVELNGPIPSVQQNMAADLTLVIGEHQPALAVPSAAIVHESTRAFVFVLRSNRVFERRAVETGPADDRFVTITNGLKADEMVAVQGTSDLQTAYASLR